MRGPNSWSILMVATIVGSAMFAVPTRADGEIANIEEGATAKLAWSGLNKPVDIAFGKDGSLYYAEFDTGSLRVIPPGAMAPAPEALWTAHDLQLGGERGFVGLAVSPTEEDTFYVFYEMNKSGTVISRLSKIRGGVETPILDDIPSGLLHNSGRIAFTPDNKMLVSVGDGIVDTIGRAASVHAHDPKDLRGKVLRLELDGTAVSDNPWGNAVWTKGHRNVYGLAVSPTGIAIGTENGPDKWDEVNVLEAGKDYGWPTCTGKCEDERYTDPIFAYESTISPTGAVWYRDAFFFTDFNKGSLHRARTAANGGWVEDRVVKFSNPRLLDVAEGPDGLYVSTWDSVWHIVPAATPTITTTPPTVRPTIAAEDTVQDEARIPAFAPLALVAILLASLLLRGREFK